MRLRHEMPVVAHGKVRFLDADAVPVLEYARYGELSVGERGDAAADGPQEYGRAGSLLVVANFSPEEASAGEQARQLAASGEWEVLLSSHGGEPDLTHLRPYEGAALLRK